MCLRPQYTNVTYKGGTGSCKLMRIIFCNVIQSSYTSLNIKFSANWTFYVPTPQFTDLTYMGGTGSCRPMTIIFDGVIESQYTSLNIKCGVIRTFHVLQTLVYRFDLYGRYRTLCTDDDNFWQCYLELVYKPKYQIWCNQVVPCALDSSLPI